jgi:hypothetical protein
VEHACFAMIDPDDGVEVMSAHGTRPFRRCMGKGNQVTAQ